MLRKPGHCVCVCVCLKFDSVRSSGEVVKLLLHTLQLFDGGNKTPENTTLSIAYKPQQEGEEFIVSSWSHME